MATNVISARSDEITLRDATERYNSVVAESRSQNTSRAYSQAMKKFMELLNDRNVNPDNAPLGGANETWIVDFIGSLTAGVAPSEPWRNNEHFRSPRRLSGDF